MIEATVNASIENVKYYTEITSGDNLIVNDEPAEMGGQNKGFNPHQTLISSLASCTAITLRMYADRKNWEIEKINIKVELDHDAKTKKAIFSRFISFEGSALTQEQIKRLHQIADACPIHKILTNSIEVDTKVV